jgi:transposase-like protein
LIQQAFLRTFSILPTVPGFLKQMGPRLIFLRGSLVLTGHCRRDYDVRFGSKADIPAMSRDARFTPESGHLEVQMACPLCARSRHGPGCPSWRQVSGREQRKTCHACALQILIEYTSPESGAGHSGTICVQARRDLAAARAPRRLLFSGARWRAKLNQAESFFDGTGDVPRVTRHMRLPAFQ